MSFRAENKESARFSYSVSLRRYLIFESVKRISVKLSRFANGIVYILAHSRSKRYLLFIVAGFFKLVFRKKFRVTAKHYIRTASRHVRRYRHRAEFARLSDYLSLALMLLCIQHIMLYTFFFEKRRKIFRLFYRNRTDQHRLPFFVTLPYLVYYRAVFSGCIFIHNVVAVYSYHRLVRGNLDDVKPVDFTEFVFLRERCSRHTRKL